jgi:hypothetical protein
MAVLAVQGVAVGLVVSQRHQAQEVRETHQLHLHLRETMVVVLFLPLLLQVQ